MKTMHWVIIGAIVAGLIVLIVTRKADTTNVITLGLLALCPIAMILMHGGHREDKNNKDKFKH